MNPSPSIKILVCYHKPAPLIKNEIFTPIHVGRSQESTFGKDGAIPDSHYQWLLDNMIGDDTGDNISRKGLKYSELTATYWAWKNYEQLGNPDYIGVMHYRRVLMFHPQGYTKKPWGIQYKGLTTNYLTEDICNTYFTPEYVREGIEQNDIYLYLKTCELPQLKTLNVTERECWEWHRSEELRISLEYLKEHRPELYAVAEEYLARTSGNRCNIFVLKRELFFEYCEFLFTALSDLEQLLDTSKYYCAYDVRVLAIVSEWLLGIWAYWKKKTGQNKVKELPIVYFLDNNFQEELRPAFSENNIPLFCACDSRYTLPCSIMLQSVVAQSSPQYNYDIVVLDNGLSPTDKKKIAQAITTGAGGEKPNNVSLRFYYMKPLMYDKSFYTRAHVSQTAYCKLFAPSIFKHYDKILYLDVDVIAMEDIASLYHTEMADHWVAATLDYHVIAEHRLGRYRTSKIKREEIGLDDLDYQYINTGVCLFNLHQLRAEKAEEHWLETALHEQFEYMDQDVLNKHCKDHVLFLDTAWNVIHSTRIRNNSLWRLPAKNNEKYQTHDKRHPKIIHYSSSEKPWYNPSLDMAQHWWTYARLSPLYEEIIYRNLSAYTNKQVNNKLATPRLLQLQEELQQRDTASYALLRKIAEHARYKRLYRWYSLRYYTTFGNLRKNYDRKRQEIKAILCEINTFLHQS